MNTYPCCSEIDSTTEKYPVLRGLLSKSAMTSPLTLPMKENTCVIDDDFSYRPYDNDETEERAESPSSEFGELIIAEDEVEEEKENLDPKNSEDSPEDTGNNNLVGEEDQITRPPSPDSDDDDGRHRPWQHKRLRRRAEYTAEQEAALEIEFQRAIYQSPQDRDNTAENLGLTRDAVKFWFQNRRRRLKRRREYDEFDNQRVSNYQQSQVVPERFFFNGFPPLGLPIPGSYVGLPIPRSNVGSPMPNSYFYANPNYFIGNPIYCRPVFRPPWNM